MAWRTLSIRPNVPVYLSWLKEISFIRYAFQALCVNEFRNADFAAWPFITS
jgi:hypothetical protein